MSCHIDDIIVLYKIQRFLGKGQVYSNKSKYIAEYRLSGAHNCLVYLVPILIDFPLLTSKRYDFIKFVNIIYLYLSLTNKVLNGVLLEHVKSVLLTINSHNKNVVNMPTSINPFWLLGFVEAEGTFGIIGLIPYFQVAQHVKSQEVLLAIKKFLLDMTNTYLPGIVNVSTFVNKRTDVIKLVISGKSDLYFITTNIFINIPFQTRKIEDFLYWSVILLMFKYKLVNDIESRQFVQQVKNYINKKRYSNARVKPIRPIISVNILNQISTECYETPNTIQVKNNVKTI